ncbi:GDSL-type esterase/lipase family protein [Lentzea sp. NPDC054927]
MRLPRARARGRALRGKSKVAVTAAIATLLITTAQPATAAPEQPSAKDVKQDQAPSQTIDPAKRGEVLGAGWQQSKDLAWTTSGDGDGFHVLVADAASGYTWRTAATLSEAGFDSDQWIGNACVTESGHRAVVVYAPRIFTNKENFAGRGAFTALVDLRTGAVTKLPIRSSLAYFNPGCGTGETAVVTQEGEDLGRTKLTKVDAGAAELGQQVEVTGQVTSAVPTTAGIVAAAGRSLVKIDDKGARTQVAVTTGTPFSVRADADGGVVYLERLGEQVRARRALPADPTAKVTTLATGALKDLGVTSGKAGKVFLTGKADSVAALPGSVKKVDVARDSTLSTEGFAAIEKSERGETPELKSDPTAVQRAKVQMKVISTGKSVGFTIDPAAVISKQSASGRTTHPSLSNGTGVQASATDLTDPVDAERTCSMPRGHAGQMPTQPTPQQAEWAADRAVLGKLEETDGAQRMFPPVGLIDAQPGHRVPPQILLGIMAQESNLWQAARFALPGVSANPLIGNYFGLKIYNKDGSDDWEISWKDADCGYGITQMTDGMRMQGRSDGKPTLPPDQQTAIALDHKTNIAAGLQLLQAKWNQTKAAGLIVNNGNPRKIENWFFAVWAYNSGFNMNNHDGQPWGVGWTNNPINPRYPENRLPFLEYYQSDAKNPQNWPYPEKIMGWAAHSIGTLSGPGFAPAWWNTVDYRVKVKPPIDQFCKPENNCYPGEKWTPDDPSVLPKPGDDPEPPGPCDHKNPATGKRDLKCWWHSPSTWKSDCEVSCGNWNFAYDDTDASPGWGTNYPPQCAKTGLPDGALIVDDLNTTPAALPAKWANPGRNCSRSGNGWANQGTFRLDFTSPSAKIDFHQIGAGFDNHFWFAHTRQNDQTGGFAKVTGTWTLNQALGWARVMVHIPDHGAHTQQAKYEIDLRDGSAVKERYINQRTERNKWVSLGVHKFAGAPIVRLSSVTQDGLGLDDIAWDAIAFQPLAQKPKHIIAALGDSYTSGEGAGRYFRETDNNHGKPEWNACRRSDDAWPRKFTLPGINGYVGNASDSFSKDVELGFVACSGAQTWNVDGGDSRTEVPWSWSQPENYELGNGQYHEMRQVDSGVLDTNTTLVTLSIGGNDAGFTDAVIECLPPFIGCADQPTYIPRYKAAIDRSLVKVERVVRRVKDKAFNAKVVLMGYPELFSQTNSCMPGIGTRESAVLNSLAQYLNDKSKEMVSRLGAQVSFADAVSHFRGHNACDQEPLIHDLVRTPRGDGDSHPGDKFGACLVFEGACLSREAFHPNTAGSYSYGRLFENKLREMNYGG